MNRVVLDASVLLAILNEERGTELFTRRLDLLENSIMSAVNVAEAYGKLVGVGVDVEDAWKAITATVSEIAAFDTGQAKVAGRLVPLTRSLGLSLGDRACLALGVTIEAPIYTSDRAWKNLKVGVAIHVIR